MDAVWRGFGNLQSDFIDYMVSRLLHPTLAVQGGTFRSAPLNMPGKYSAGADDITPAQGRKNGAVVAVRRRFPFRTPTREEKTRAGCMKIVDAAHQPRHGAGLKKDAVEGAIGFLPSPYISGMIACTHCLFGAVKDRRGKVGCRISQGEGFKRGAHSCDFADLCFAETRNPHAFAWLADGKTLGLKPPESLTHRHVAGPEFSCDVILPQALTGPKRA